MPDHRFTKYKHKLKLLFRWSRPRIRLLVESCGLRGLQLKEELIRSGVSIYQQGLVGRVSRAASFLIMFWAFVMLSGRALMPLFNSHVDIRNLIKEYVPLDLEIQNAQGQWGLWGPELHLDGVNIVVTDIPVMHYDHLVIKVGLMKSILSRSIMINEITASGLNLSAVITSNGDIRVDGLDPLLQLPSKSSEADFPLVLNAVRVLDGNITVEREGQGALSLAKVAIHLALKPDEFAVWAKGNIASHHEMPFELLVLGEIEDEKPSPKNMKAYIKIHGLTMDEVSLVTPSTLKVSQLQSRFDISLWGILSSLNDYSFISKISMEDFGSKDSQSRLQGGVSLALSHFENKTVVIGTDIWASEGVRAPGSASFMAILNEEKQLDFIIKDADLGPWLMASSYLIPNQTFRDSIESYEPEALMSLVKGQVNLESGYYKVMGKLQNAQIRATDFSPGIQGVDGTFLMDESHGRFMIKSPFFSIAYHHQDKRPIVLSSLIGAFDWTRDVKGWKLYIPQVTASLENAPLVLKGIIRGDTGEAVRASMSATLGPMQVKTVVDALPAGVIGQDTVNWCRSSLEKGVLTGVNLVFRGPFTGFPFDKNDGVFEALAPFEGLVLNYDPEWPKLESMRGALKFSNRRLDIHSPSGTILGLPYLYATGVIPDLGGPTPEVIVKSEIPIPFPFAKMFILGSPLRKTVGKMYDHMQISGHASLDLGLHIPLSQQDKRKLQVTGLIGIEDAELALKAYPLKVNHIQGQLRFSQAGVDASGIKGTLFERPALFDVVTEKRVEKRNGGAPKLLANKQAISAQEILTVNVVSNIKVEALEREAQWNLRPMLEGDIDYRAKIAINMDAAEDVEIFCWSDLLNTKIDLPDPFKKDLGIKSKAWVRAQVGSSKKIDVVAGYREDATWVSTHLNKNGQWTMDNGRLYFGITERVAPTASGQLLVDGKVSWVDVDAWKDFYKKLPPSASKTPMVLKPHFDLHFGNVKVMGSTYADVRVKAIPEAAEVLLDIGGSNAVGTIRIPYDNKDPIVARMSKFTLLSSTAALNDPAGTWPYPPLDFIADELILSGNRLKKVHLLLSPTPSGYHLDKIHASLEHAQLEATGYWDRVSLPHQSEIKGTIRTLAAGEMLKEWGISSSLKEAAGTLDFDLRWPGDIVKPDLLFLEGQLALQYGQGRVLGVDPGLGRILSLLNLNTLFKRFQLDFSDVVKDGFPFDRLNGTILLRGGRARSNDLVMEGSSARINFYGDYLILSSLLDVDLIIIPNVSGTLPLAAAITAGNPAVGAAVWMVDRMTGGRLSEITRYHYHVGGSIETPIIENKGQVSPDFKPKERR